MRYLYILVASIVFISCGKNAEKGASEEGIPQSEPIELVEEAEGFSIEKGDDFTIIEVFSPWPNAEKSYRYALIPKEKAAAITLSMDAYDAIVLTPIESIVVTSTTHIPSLEALQVEHTLKGFPNTRYISSETTRANIDAGKIKEVGNNESVNTEVLIDIHPDAVVGFAIDGNNKAYNNLTKANIPVLYNGDWTEKTPLGKAEWIKFFGALYGKESAADSIFNGIRDEYLKVKALAQTAKSRPTVLSGALYRDIWYLPAGESYQTQFMKDAHANYLWATSKGTGSLSLNVESVLEKGRAADFWIAPGQFTSYSTMIDSNPHYAQFEALQQKKIFTFNATTGSTGGTLYYELGPNRPDIVLKDLIKIMHPELLPDYKPFFFKPLVD